MKYARHAQHVSAGNGALSEIQLPTQFEASNATLVEAEINPETGAVEKQVWRMPLDDTNDLCFPMLAGGFVKTGWLHARSDTHATLQRTRYVGGAQGRKMRHKLPCAPLLAA